MRVPEVGVAFDTGAAGSENAAMRGRATRWRYLAALVPLAVALAIPSPRAHQPEQPRPAALQLPPVDFNRQIRPLLSDRCFRCHGPDASKRKAKLRLDTREGVFKALDAGMAVVTAGDLTRSEMIRRIQLPADDEDLMPPADAHLALSAAEKALLVRWVREGATYRAHWSWEPVASPQVPTLQDGGS
jgi:uncharacterized membrane protein